ncbi:hypothetical protein NPIL_203931, partial [Nephila pilipes]
KKIHELKTILWENNVHIACLQEIKLNPNLKFTIKGYTTLRKDRKDRSGGGLAFLIKFTVIKFRVVSLPPNFQANSECSTEAHAISVTLPQQEVTIINAYHPDNTNTNVDFLNSLVDTNSGTRIILGDFNAKNPSWGSLILDSKGSQIEDLLCDIDFSILNNKENTYLSKTKGTSSALDNSAHFLPSCKGKKWAEFCEKLDPRRISQHWKVIKTLNNQPTLGKVNLQSNTISLSGRNAATNKETAQMLAEHYETKSKLDFNANDKILLKAHRNSMKFSRNCQINDIFPERISMEEIDFEITKMDPRKS